MSNPVERIAGKTVGKAANALNRPMGRNRPFYAMGIVDALRGKTLENAVNGKVVMITGASSGIGLATAHRIGAAGGEVVLVARGREKLEEAAEAIRAEGGIAHVFPCDLSDMEAVQQLGLDVEAELGRIDILVNNAGRSIRRSLKLSYDRFHDYQRTMQLNYFAPVRLMLTVLPGMRERGHGHVVNISSIGTLTRVPRFGAYIASKAALDMLCDAWQAETQGDQVRFTTVHMPLVRTPMISATTLYDKFPTLTPDEAADVVCEAIIHRPRRLSPAAGSIASVADAVSPQIMDRVRHQGYKMFGDSKAAKGEATTDGGAEEQAEVSATTRKPLTKTFITLTRGNHW